MTSRPFAKLLLFLASPLVACGGTTQTGGAHDSGTSDARPSTHADGGLADGAMADAKSWSPVCPEATPAMGGPCNLNDVSCEYGCGNILVCAGGTWGGEVGFGPVPCGDAGPNPASCPATLAQVGSGSCSSTGTCTYAKGACTCAFPGDPIPDASASWTCFPQPACPWPRARVGSACGVSGMTCDYATCGSSQTCQAGVWQATPGGCSG